MNPSHERADPALPTHVNQLDLLEHGEHIVKALRWLAGQGLNRGSSGNVSVRIDADHFLISPSGVAKAELQSHQMVLMAISGTVLSAGKPSSEWLMHRDIYVNRPEVNAVVHTHSDYATGLACAQKDMPAFHYMVAVTGASRIRCAPYALFGSQALSDHALAALKGAWACLLANHGVLAIHRVLDKALYIAQEVESLAHQYTVSHALGQPRLLDNQQMQEVMQQFEGYGLTRVDEPQPFQDTYKSTDRSTDKPREVITGSAVKTLSWGDDHLTMIDQRLLPREFVQRHYRDAVSVAEAIKTMVVRGAPAIGVAAAYGIALEAVRFSKASRTVLVQQLQTAQAVLAKSRPTAVNLSWALNRMQRVWTIFLDGHPQASSAEVAHCLVTQAQLIEREDIAANQAMGRHGAALMPTEGGVLTHCNAGALATAGHGTALGVIRSAVQDGKKIHVYADETRPFLQGARLTAWELQQDQIPVTLLTDNAAGWAMQSGLIKAVIVGADRVAANGDVANKIGTYMVAVLARRHNIPFYVAAPVSTIDRQIATGTEIPIEMRSADEVLGYGGQRWAADGVQVFNPSFDVTPAELITALITEQGIIEAPNLDRMTQFFKMVSE